MQRCVGFSTASSSLTPSANSIFKIFSFICFSQSSKQGTFTIACLAYADYWSYLKLAFNLYTSFEHLSLSLSLGKKASTNVFRAFMILKVTGSQISFFEYFLLYLS